MEKMKTFSVIAIIVGIIIIIFPGILPYAVGLFLIAYGIMNFLE
ncbi:MAG: DUF3096 domain-containing protein [Methanobacteriaceae archaeon]|jgi:uncharacterized membrane protein HdeD (DUF308 family)|nr:DUF3096 domain-containing protein [Methanobacteriaceae archaeon]